MLQAVISVWPQLTEQLALLPPLAVSVVHAIRSLHAALLVQLPSQASPGSLTLLPQTAGQSWSVV